MAAPVFDPSQPFTSIAAPTRPTFDPNKPFTTSAPTSAASDGPGIGEAALRGAAQGATFGLGDEIGGGIQAAGEMLLPESLGGADRSGKPGLTQSPGAYLKELVGRYRDNRDMFRRENEAAARAHPISYGLGGVAGGLASAPLIPGSFVSTTGRAIATGAGLGTLGSLANSNADLTRGEIGQAAEDASGLTGARAAYSDAAGGSPGRALLDILGAGPIGGAILSASAGPATRALARVMRRGANTLAVEAIGPKLSDLRSMEYQGATQPFGQELLDKNIIPWGGGIENIRARAAAEAAKQGQRIGSALDGLDARAAAAQAAEVQRALPAASVTSTPANGLFPLSELGIRAPQEQLVGPRVAGPTSYLRANAEPTVSESATTAVARPPPGAVAPASPPSAYDLLVRPSQVRAKALEQVVQPIELSPGVAKAGFSDSVPTSLRAQIEKLQSPGDRLTFQNANDQLGNLDEGIAGDYGREAGPYVERMKQVRGILRGEQQLAAERVDPALAKDLSDAKTSYGNMARASGISEDKALRNLKNRDFSPSDYAVGLSELMKGGEGGGVVKSLATAIGHKLLRERGAAFTANLLNAAAPSPTATELLQKFFAAPNQSAQSILLGNRDPQQRRAGLVRVLDPTTGRELGRSE